MTLNGQMIVIELLHLLNDVIVDLTEVNNDGLILLIKEKDLRTFYQTLDDFEKWFNFTIDTCDEINMGGFFSANQKKFCGFNNGWVVKGFGDSLAFNIKTHVLKHLLFDFPNIKTNEDLFHSVLKSYKKLVDAHE